MENAVFLVHGRNSPANDAIRLFLSTIGLHVVEWSEAKNQTRDTNPYIGDIVDTGFRLSRATVVLLTPDEIAFLRIPFRKHGDTTDDTGPGPQPRPNVLYELGWAMKGHKNRTVIVQVGEGRLPSDLSGRHIVRFDGSPEARHALVDELAKIEGLTLHTQGDHWLRVGKEDFAKILKHEFDPKHQWIPAGIKVRDSVYRYKDVIDDSCQDVTITGINFADQLGVRGNPPSPLHKALVSALQGVNKSNVTLAFSPYRLLKEINPPGHDDLIKFAIPRMLDLYNSNELTAEQRERLNIIEHPGALFTQLFIRDPDDNERGLIVVTPRWITDTQGDRRMYFAVHKADNRELFDALWTPMFSDLRVNPSRRSLQEVAAELNIV